MCYKDILMDLSWKEHALAFTGICRATAGSMCYVMVLLGRLLPHACIATFRSADRCSQRWFASCNTPLVGQCCIQLFFFSAAAAAPGPLPSLQQRGRLHPHQLQSPARLLSLTR
jgi:hypothetical protein